MSANFDKYSDIIDSRDIVERIEELRSCALCGGSDGDTCEQYREDCPACQDGEEHPHEFDLTDEEYAELTTLEALVAQVNGSADDDAEDGVTLIRDSHFKEYAQELADELDLLPKDYSWPTSCIDWEQAARELRMDYSSVDFDGVTYWVR